MTGSYQNHHFTKIHFGIFGTVVFLWVLTHVKNSEPKLPSKSISQIEGKKHNSGSKVVCN
jgi:hypothetical protein